MTTFQKPSWRRSTRDGRWRRGIWCCVSKPDPRPSMAQTWGSMTSPAGGVYHQTTSDLRAPVDQLLQPTAPGSSWWVRESSVMARGPHLSPAPPRRLWLEARRRPALLYRAAAAAACKARAGLLLRLTALLTDRLKPSLPRHPPCPAYPPPPPHTPPMPPQNDPHSHTHLRGRTQSPWEPWNNNKVIIAQCLWWCEWIIYAVLVLQSDPKYLVNTRPYINVLCGRENTQWRINLEICHVSLTNPKNGESQDSRASSYKQSELSKLSPRRIHINLLSVCMCFDIAFCETM